MKNTATAMILACVMILSLTAGALAQTVEPLVPEMLLHLVAGKTFIAQMNGFSSDEEMEHAILSFQISGQESYTAEAVEALQPQDTIVVGGDPFVIQEIKQDEFGYEATGEYYTIFLYKE